MAVFSYNILLNISYNFTHKDTYTAVVLEKVFTTRPPISYYTNVFFDDTLSIKYVIYNVFLARCLFLTTYKTSFILNAYYYSLELVFVSKVTTLNLFGEMNFLNVAKNIFYEVF